MISDIVLKRLRFVMFILTFLSTTQLVILFLFLCLSRFGLWSFDLCQTQLMQLKVHRQHAGVINGSQETLVNTGYIVSFLLTIIFSDPALFAVPAWISFLAVVCSAACYTHYASRELGTANPFPPLETFKLHRKVEYDPTVDGGAAEQRRQQQQEEAGDGEEEQKSGGGTQYEAYHSPQEGGVSTDYEEAASTTSHDGVAPSTSYIHHGSYVSASY